MENIKEFFLKYVNDYNQTWINKNMELLKEYYDTDNDRLIYFDNHKNNDTYKLKDHIALVSDFLNNGKKTESGQVEELIIENFNVFYNDNSACLCFIARYKSFPVPGVRTTMYIEKIKNKWKTIHVHCSFEPEK